jgi:hypothetical protein
MGYKDLWVMRTMGFEDFDCMFNSKFVWAGLEGTPESARCQMPEMPEQGGSPLVSFPVILRSLDY